MTSTTFYNIQVHVTVTDQEEDLDPQGNVTQLPAQVEVIVPEKQILTSKDIKDIKKRIEKYYSE